MLGIQQALAVRGWSVLRVPPSIYSAKGWCDLIAIKAGRVAFIEVKNETGRLSKDQEVFAKRIDYAGGTYIIARSEDYVLDILENGDNNDR
jgi:Holliday junction resolvase